MNTAMYQPGSGQLKKALYFPTANGDMGHFTGVIRRRRQGIMHRRHFLSIRQEKALRADTRA
jgi:hypothetical protein